MTDVDLIDTPLGPCWAALRDGRLIALSLGEGPLEGRRKRLPLVRRWLAAWFAGREPRVPMRLEGTPLTKRIYEVVRRIPRGGTMTYGEVADAAGRPGAARAVGAAMAACPIPLFIPCHRVVAAGGLGGYGGPAGLVLKKRLLSLESDEVPIRFGSHHLK